MDRSVVGFVEGMVTFIVLAATGLSAASLWLRARNRPQQSPDTAALEALREENALLRAHVAELAERVDFVERRLVQERQPQQLPPERERTPV